MLDGGNTKPKNTPNRSLFGMGAPIFGSSYIGQIDPVQATFCLPFDTIKNRMTVCQEMRATRDRFNGKVTNHGLSAAVPIPTIWKFFDQFISKGHSIVQNGAFNVPTMIKSEDESVHYMPSFDATKVIPYLMLSLSPYASGVGFHRQNNLINFTANYADAKDGNKQDYQFDYIDSDGFPQFTNHSSTVTTWWLPKLIGSGYSQSGINVNFPVAGDTYKYRVYHFSDPEIISVVKYLVRNSLEQDVDFTTVRVACACKISADNSLYFSVCLGDDVYTSPSNFALNTFDFSISDAPATYGNVTFLNSDIKPRIVNNPEPTTTGLIHFRGDVAFHIAALCFFNRPALLGAGSLAESLGVHFFTVQDWHDLYTPWSSYGSDGVYRALSPLIAVGLNPMIMGNYLKSSPNKLPFGILHFLAYQYIVSNRFLLPHEVLSNNPGQDSTVMTTPFDSPYFRNNMIPTQCYVWDDVYLADLLGKGSVVVKNGSSPSFAKVGMSSSNFSANDYHQLLTANQWLSILFARNCMIETDMLNRIWQKRDHDVQNVLSDKGYVISDINRVLDAKQFLLSYATKKLIKFGGLDQSAEAVISRIFGLNKVDNDKNCDMQVLASDSFVIETSDVVNSGGAVDSEGQPLPLGSKSSVALKSFKNQLSYKYLSQNFCIIMDLNWLTVGNIYDQVPNVINSLNANDKGVRDDFQTSFFEMYQSSGDEALRLCDIYSFAEPTALGWTHKNFNLKDAVPIVRGDVKTKFRHQLCTSTLSYQRKDFGPSLTYGYLQPISMCYNSPFVDKYGSNFVTTYVVDKVRNSTMTKINEVL